MGAAAASVSLGVERRASMRPSVRPAGGGPPGLPGSQRGSWGGWVPLQNVN